LLNPGHLHNRSPGLNDSAKSALSPREGDHTQESPRSRNANLGSTIYQGKNGRWQGRVTIGVRDDGRADRRHVRGATRAGVARKVRALEQERDSGTARPVGQRWTVAGWLEYWIGNIACTPHIAENTHAGYCVDVVNHLVPGIGAHRLDKLTPEHVERLYGKLQRNGLSPGGVHHVHRTLRAALNEAVRRSHLTRNPVLLAKAPKLAEKEVQPYGIEEIQRLLKVASEGRNSARWALALALGLRQGEALGLRWEDVELDHSVLRVRRSRLRPKYAHGCDGTCGQAPGLCPQRVNSRPAAGDVKSKAGRRTIGLPLQLVALLRAHRAEQQRERQLARHLWQDEGWVFASPAGEPVKPHTDYREWKRLLRQAGLREARLHDARHTAATVLLLLDVPARTVMSLMGWSSAEMAARYQHVTDTIREGVARQVDSLIWQAADTETGESTVPVSRGSLTAILRLAELGLVPADQAVMADAQRAVEQIRAVLAGGIGGPAGRGDARRWSAPGLDAQNELRPDLRPLAARRPLAIEGPQESAGQRGGG
jgi:integrase